MGIKIYIGQRETGPIESKTAKRYDGHDAQFYRTDFFRILVAEIFQNTKKRRIFYVRLLIMYSEYHSIGGIIAFGCNLRYFNPATRRIPLPTCDL